MGLNERNTIILECHHEFTETELMAFVKENMADEPSIERLEELPVWLPKRPLVMQMLLKYAGDILSVGYALDDICGFWYAFLSKICEREARIYPALNPLIIQGVLINLANKTRMCVKNTGPILQSDLSDAFAEVAGFYPNDESSIMLQRLPSLGRISADSPDRQFLDTFILNGLRAEGIIQLSKSWDLKRVNVEWMNPLDQVGLSILSEYISKEEKRIDTFLLMARQAAKENNKILASDIVAALCMLDIKSIDFHGLEIQNGHFSFLTFEGKEINGLTLNGCIIERFDLTNAKLGDNTRFSDCMISTAYGVAAHRSLPHNFTECSADNFETLATTTLVKKARLSEAQKLLVQMLRKMFIQPGSGRKETALLRGMGSSVNKKLSMKILGTLIDEGLITTHKGDEGMVYVPVRSKMARIDGMLTNLTLCTDPVWLKISEYT